MNKLTQILISLAVSVSFVSCTLPKEKAEKSRKARSVVVNGKSLPVYQSDNEVLSVKILLEKMKNNDPGVYVGKLTLEKGARVSPHTHSDSDEILLITEGEGEMILGKEFVDVGADSVVFVSKGTLHSFRVKGPNTVRAVQIYNPSGPEQRFKEWSIVDTEKSTKKVTQKKSMEKK